MSYMAPHYPPETFAPRRPPRKRWPIIVAGVVLALAVVLAGIAWVLGSTTSEDAGPVAAPTDIHSEREVLAELPPEIEGPRTGWHVEGRWCYAAVVLTSAADVSYYADAGDVVASNPSRTAGVKVGGDDEPFCQAWFTRAFSDLD